MTERKYEFVRFNYKGQPDMGGKHWWFVAKTVDDVIEHSNRVFKPVMQEGFDSYAHQYIESLTNDCYLKRGHIYIPHALNKVEGAMRDIWAAKNNTTSHNPHPLQLFETANSMYLDAFQGRLRDVLKGSIYLEDGVRQFGYTEGNPHYEIVERVYQDKFEYPDTEKATLEDVEFIQWPGGKHWYAKLRKEDVVDRNGNQKWDSRMEAMRAAKWYIETYYE